MRGVNLGGWLVLEKWMTPTLFKGVDAVDEYTFMQTKGAREKLREHQKNFMRETDFKWLRDNGVQAVRIPVGYWILDGDSPFVSSIGRLDWAFKMAEKYGLEVLLCLHGAPGSQNGRDHSGRVGKALWYRDKRYQAQTIEVLEKLAARYRNSPRLWGIELVNEPKVGIIQRTLRRLYKQAYMRLTKILKPSTRIVFSDAFTPRLMNAALGDRSHRAVMDIHWYHFALPLHRFVPLGMYWWIVAMHGQLAANLRNWQGVIVGEWSGVLSGERLRRVPKEQHESLQRIHIQKQLVAYEHADAWFYWTYKTEAPGIWNYRSLAEGDVVFSDNVVSE